MAPEALFSSKVKVFFPEPTEGCLPLTFPSNLFSYPICQIQTFAVFHGEGCTIWHTDSQLRGVSSVCTPGNRYRNGIRSAESFGGSAWEGASQRLRGRASSLSGAYSEAWERVDPGWESTWNQVTCHRDQVMWKWSVSEAASPTQAHNLVLSHWPRVRNVSLRGTWCECNGHSS